MSPNYVDKRKWFFNTFSQNLQNHIRTRWYNEMNETKTDMREGSEFAIIFRVVGGRSELLALV